MFFGSNRAGVFITSAPGERGSSRTKTDKTKVKKEAEKPKTKKETAKPKAKKETAADDGLQTDNGSND